MDTAMNRASGILNDLIGRVADTGRGLMKSAPQDDIFDICEALLSGKGEATGLAQARVIFDRYAALSAEKKQVFFATLRDRFGVDRAKTEAAYNAQELSLRALHAASEPRSQELIRRLNRAPGGTLKLVAMRQDLLAFMDKDASLKPLDDDFRHLFSSWFNRGFLELRSIDWNTSAAVLEKIIRYEAVHEISGWSDLRRRVAAPDRRLYAFFHPALLDDPLIFVEVALTPSIPGNIDDILASERKMLTPDQALTAVFYSISNCQDGLRGISFGNFLIKQVVEELRRDFGKLTTFVTLSPVPGLRKWALAQVADKALPERLAKIVEQAEAGNTTADLAELTAHYMLVARSARGGATDPVARFHLGNGARLERIHPNADKSERGQAASWGVMVNYLYDLATIERNHEAYSTADDIIASTQVRRLLKTR
ncbi:malonyl-CoA decarboxylase [Sulfitobacter brevis]|uniref:Malonyl-CoA decarboxylase n=2 Tax=Sulfitobacter brevis TaxID=74348 RepID=A0A1I2E3P0_9RHOB|nr:malonyl-CoA decarboxylase [Sulfitobacter brevis]